MACGFFTFWQAQQYNAPAKRSQSQPDQREVFSSDSCKHWRMQALKRIFKNKNQAFYFVRMITDSPNPMRCLWNSTYGKYIFKEKAKVSEAVIIRITPFFSLFYWHNLAFPHFYSSYFPDFMFWDNFQHYLFPRVTTKKKKNKKTTAVCPFTLVLFPLQPSSRCSVVWGLPTTQPAVWF